MRRILSVAALVVAMSVLAAAADTAPKLVVVLVVDQMRADYVERFRDNWSSGPPPARGRRRMVHEGGVSVPHDRDLRRPRDDWRPAPTRTGTVSSRTRGTTALVPRSSPAPTTSPLRAVPYGKEGNSRTGPGQLLVPSLADRMRLQGGHVVTLALKARSAIMLAGHGGDAVSWISESLDGWESSTAFTPAPIPQVKAFLAANPMDADYGKSWTHLLPASSYKDADDGLAEAPIRGWTIDLPAHVDGRQGRTTPDTSYYDQWQHSPYADAYVAQDGRVAGGIDAAGQARRRRFPRREFLEPRSRRTFVRPAQPGSPGHVRASRRIDRRIAERARPPGRTRSVRARASVRITAWPTSRSSA